MPPDLGSFRGPSWRNSQADLISQKISNDCLPESDSKETDLEPQ